MCVWMVGRRGGGGPPCARKHGRKGLACVGPSARAVAPKARRGAVVRTPCPQRHRVPLRANKTTPPQTSGGEVSADGHGPLRGTTVPRRHQDPAAETKARFCSLSDRTGHCRGRRRGAGCRLCIHGCALARGARLCAVAVAQARPALVRTFRRNVNARVPRRQLCVAWARGRRRPGRGEHRVESATRSPPATREAGSGGPPPPGRAGQGSPPLRMPRPGEKPAGPGAKAWSKGKRRARGALRWPRSEPFFSSLLEPLLATTAPAFSAPF